MLDKVWELVRHSALYVSQEQFVDTPTREKGQFLGDCFNDSQATMHAFGEQNLTWQALAGLRALAGALLARREPQRRVPERRRQALDSSTSPSAIPSGCGSTTCRPATAPRSRSSIPVVQRVAGYLDSLVNPSTGLVTYTATDGADLVDWPPAMQYGYDMTRSRTRPRTCSRSTTSRAPRRSRRCSASRRRARRSRRGATSSSTAINAKLTRPDGVYVDGLEADGTPSPHASQQASEFALAFGIVPPARSRRSASTSRASGSRPARWTACTCSTGCRPPGRTADVVRVLTDTKDPGWAHIVADGGTFAWESWILSDLEGDGMSHGWGSSALVAFQTALLGVTPDAAGRGAGGPVVDIDAPTAGPGACRGPRADDRGTGRRALAAQRRPSHART